MTQSIQNKTGSALKPSNRMILCSPTYYEVIYSINPWMDPSNPVDKNLAWRQWARLVTMLENLGQELIFIEPKKGCPDMVFLGDAGVIIGDRFLCSRFRHREREPEAQHYVDSFSQIGYKVEQVPEHAVFEGLGDVSFYGKKAIFGYGPRSNTAGLSAFREFVPFLNVIAEAELPDPRFYHLATAVNFLNEDTIMYYPRAFTPRGARAIRESVANVIEVGDDDIMNYQACNCIVVKDVVLMDGCSRELERTLNQHGYSVQVCPASEFKKGGGSLRCLVLPEIVKP